MTQPQPYLLAIDQGTTNSRAIIFDHRGRYQAHHELALTQIYPQEGWVEQNPIEMLNHSIICCQTVMQKMQLPANAIAAIGITNQRETTIIWDKTTGQPIYPAIVWQDRRTSVFCQEIRRHPFAYTIKHKTGLVIDPYFSATKMCWLLDQVPQARTRAQAGELLFGTVNTFLLWHLTRGQAHCIDGSNACRTLLYNIHSKQWDDELIQFFNIPATLLPTLTENTADFGETAVDYFGSPIPITAMAGDQHAATVGQACFTQGMIKMTYGTGGFMMLNTGDEPVPSQHQLLTTLAYQYHHHTHYALEGSIFSAGTTIKWLRDSLGLIHSAPQTETLAQSIESTEGVQLVPAFTGLGAPYWDAEARGALLGLTRQTGVAHIARAALESVCYQTKDLLTAMQLDSKIQFTVLRADGGMASNNWLLQFLADMLDLEVQRPHCIETTALGVAYLAGLQIGLFTSLQEIASLWESNISFFPKISNSKRQDYYDKWHTAVQRVLTA